MHACPQVEALEHRIALQEQHVGTLKTQQTERDEERRRALLQHFENQSRLYAGRCGTEEPVPAPPETPKGRCGARGARAVGQRSQPQLRTRTRIPLPPLPQGFDRLPTP